jgi:hypothetical protein
MPGRPGGPKTAVDRDGATLINVVLPAPLGPTMPTRSPRMLRDGSALTYHFDYQNGVLRLVKGDFLLVCPVRDTGPWLRVEAMIAGADRTTRLWRLFSSTRSEMKDSKPSNPFKKQPQNHGAATPPR